MFKLLPHTKEKIYGFNSKSAQVIGWEISQFNIEKYWQYSTGQNIRIAVLDTGCDKNHEDLKDNIVDGYNAIDQNSNASDDNGHGTHVAGTIAAKNNLTGMVGVSPESKIVPVKVLNKRGSGSAKNIANGIIWAADHGCDLITMSLASPSSSSLVEEAIVYATNKGVIVVCAAGNNGNSTPIMYPAKMPETIAIGSIGQNLGLSNFSCVGPELDFLSPGENIFSCAPGNSYTLMSGTSMSTPYAIGCIALTLSAYKNKQIKISLKKNDIVKLFSQHIIKANITNNVIGCGIIQPLPIKE